MKRGSTYIKRNEKYKDTKDMVNNGNSKRNIKNKENKNKEKKELVFEKKLKNKEKETKDTRYFVERDRNRRKMAKTRMKQTDFRGKKEKWLQDKKIHIRKKRK